MKQIGISKFFPAIVWFFVVLLLICLPGKDIPKMGWADEIQFDKLVHMGVFGLLALLIMLPVAYAPMKDKDRLLYFLLIAVATAIWGLTTEFIQRFWIPGRSFDLFDWAADSIGAFGAFFVCRKKLYTVMGKSARFFYR